MKKYDPNENIVCPKCGDSSDAKDMPKVFWSEVISTRQDKTPYLRLECRSCSHGIKRRPLDYKGDD